MKSIKEEFRKKASKNPEKYYAVDVLKSEGFSRKKCGKCGIFFWTADHGREVCGDPACSGGFQFFDRKIKKKLDYIKVWKEFAKLFSALGYTPIKRYPVVARWRNDTDFVQASIYDFQPWVVSGEIEPPANPLVVPQLALRFNDIDNVGITGAHYTLFSMIGQHAFMSKDRFDQNKYFNDIHSWLKTGHNLKNEEIVFHEDSWAGGGNFGPCMEYFSHGLELGNQVYMLYQQTPSGPKELKLKVLDMGMGHERNAWFSTPTATSYESVFPEVVEKLKKITGLDTKSLFRPQVLRYLSYLNADEVGNMDKAWKNVAKASGIDNIKEQLLPIAAMYSIAEHSRALLVAITDGALPSNVGGGYNLRVLLRRALDFTEKYGWDINLSEVCKWHAKYLKPIYPELAENLDEVEEIIEHEKSKYSDVKKKNASTVARISKKRLGLDKLIELYDSHGITPEIVKKEADKHGIKVEIPENFYALVAERHEQKEEEKEEETDISDVADTELLYMKDYKTTEFKAGAIKITGNKVILDKTYFYPTSGGQMNDKGTINNVKVVDVIKQKRHVLHVLADKPNFKAGDEISCKIDWDRRKQLTQHHTATHVINAAARKVLGMHIFQAGASKSVEKANLDVTHYKKISQTELNEIENQANNIVKESHEVEKMFLPRNEAEQKYGFRIYQGGAVPGKKIRIVNIHDVDVEACGGTHVDNTKEIEKIIITGSERLQDGVVRIKFIAGKAARDFEKQVKQDVDELCKLLNTDRGRLVKKIELLKKEQDKKRKLVKEDQKNVMEKLAERFKERKNIIEKVNFTDLPKLAKALCSENKLVILFNHKKQVIIAVGKNRTENAHHLMQTIVKELGGKGGGRKEVAQGVVADFRADILKKIRKRLENE